MALTPAECEFVAEDTLVSIVPNFTMDQLRFVGGTYGPFRPQRPVRVPLWLAVTLKKRQKCKIQPPPILSLRTLQDLYAREQDPNSDGFERVPFHYLEIAFLLLDCASDDIAQPNQVRTVLEDLREQRQAKIRMLFQLLARSQSAAPVKLNNVAMMELNEARPLLLRSLHEINMLTLRTTDDEFQDGGAAAADSAGGPGDALGGEDADGARPELGVRPARTAR